MKPRSQSHNLQNPIGPLFYFLLVLFLLIFTNLSVFAQAGTNSTGNGGRHVIQGRIFGESGRRIVVDGLKVTLQSFGLGDLTVFVDSNGAFVFRNLAPGSYVVLIDGNATFEPIHEPVYIDAPGGSASISAIPRMGSAPTVVPVQIFLKPKRVEALRNEVLNAKWSAIPRDAIQHFKRGLEFLENGKEGEAEAEFRSAVSIAPNFAPAHTRIGNLELKAGKLEAAVESFKQAIRYDASDFDANLGLGIAYLNQKKFDDAEPPLVTAAYLDRYAVTPHYYLGLVFSAKNNPNVAQKAFERVKELNGAKSLPVVHKYLGRIYMHKQMNKEAVTEFEAYLSSIPNAKDAVAIRKDIADIKSRQ